MKKYKLLLFLLLSINAFSQNGNVEYSPAYVFNEGIYLTLNDFKANRPIPKLAVISQIPINEVNYLDEVLEQKEFSYIDSQDNKQTTTPSEVWGFYQNNILHINFKDKFVRVNLIGTMCEFTAIITSVITNPSPMFPGYPGYGYGPTTSTVQEMRLYVLDTRNNKTTEFTIRNMEQIIADDPELLNEYLKLKRRKKSDLLFYYLRKYNERHPLYLPN